MKETKCFQFYKSDSNFIQSVRKNPYTYSTHSQYSSPKTEHLKSMPSPIRSHNSKKYQDPKYKVRMYNFENKEELNSQIMYFPKLRTLESKHHDISRNSFYGFEPIINKQVFKQMRECFKVQQKASQSTGISFSNKLP